MTDRPAKHSFAARPRDPEDWVKSASSAEAKRPDYTARLTIDITPELRGRIKIAAFERGVTVADMLRDLLACEFPEPEGGQP
ncbi:ribbon-helix-helix protein [Pelagibacterium sp.]|uniref:ribbon-helix-helix protein n=1 Tax=Pelagibacterium sp. TaxID=1967288 RepID=UPI003BAD6BA0